MKRIGVLTSGGDAPGMNAAIRSVVRTAISYNMQVVGVKRGFYGLVFNEMFFMNSRSVADIIHRGGTMLRTARCEEFKTEEGLNRALEAIRDRGIEGMIVIGGDGSLRGALELSARGIPTVGIPATIDNDLACTDYAIGFDTAVNTAVEAINKIRDTATSHERTYVVEVMGRNSGFIALEAGLAGGAESILIPEVEFDLRAVCDRIRKGHQKGKLHSIIVVAEGAFGSPAVGVSGQASAGMKVGAYIKENTGFETRVTILGHIQRGGNPTVMDRNLASRFGYAALQLLRDGKDRRMVGIRGNSIESFDMMEVLSQQKSIDKSLYELANVLSI